MDKRRPHPEAVETRQLPLPRLDSPWRLDERTRAIGLRGVAEARAAVLRARRPAA